MKIRTDFVTNSSSSSYVTITATTKNGKNSYLLDDEFYYDLDNVPYFEKGKLFYTRETDGKKKEIETVGELMGVLAARAFGNDLFNNEFVYVFRYKLGDLSNEELAKEILESKAFRFRYGWRNEYETASELAENLEELIGNKDYKNKLEAFMEFARDYTLDDIQCINAGVSTLERGHEGVGQFFEKLDELIDDGTIEFNQMDRDNSTFEETVEKLVKQIEELVFEGKSYEASESLDELVENGLESGDAWDMIPDSIEFEDEMVLNFTKCED